MTGRLSWQLNEVKARNAGWFDDAPEIETFTRVPTRMPSIAESIGRQVAVYDPGLGARAAYVDDAAAGRVRTYEWVLKSRAEVADFRAFLRSPLGTRDPVYMPSWQRDFSLIGSYDETQTEFSFAPFGYVDKLFPQGTAYRGVIFRSPDGQAHLSGTVIGAGTDGDGNELFELSAPLGTAVTPDWKVMFLRYCRLDDDATEFRWKSGQVATVQLVVRQIPLIEVPT